MCGRLPHDDGPFEKDALLMTPGGGLTSTSKWDCLIKPIDLMVAWNGLDEVPSIKMIRASSSIGWNSGPS